MSISLEVRRLDELYRYRSQTSPKTTRQSPRGRSRTNEKVVLLAEEPRPPGTVKLKGYDREYRIRVGDYRVRYEISDEELIVLLLHCKHRRDVYRRN